MRTITPTELQRRIERGETVTIVDVRDAESFSDWHIPGARNIDVLEEMRANDMSALDAHLESLPHDEPLVMVCNIGVSAGKAAHVLEGKGFDALNLEGGMQGWSGVHSEAIVDLTGSPEVTVVQVRRNGKGCLSYFVASAGQALVIDPSAEIGAYRQLAERFGAEIVMVLETHVHADHISRARVLAEACDAALALPRNDRVNYAYEAVHDHTPIQLGEVTLEAIHTPGHTGESTSYRLDDRALFTGDTLFTDSVGRPDLEKGNEGAPDSAAILHRTLFEVIGKLPDRLLVLPCHTEAGIPFDGKPVAARLGDLRTAMADYGTELEAFVPEILGRLGPKPPSFDRVIAVNEGKAPPADEEDALAIEAGPNRCAAK